MSFAEFHRVIKENDTIILYVGIDNLYALEVKKTVTSRKGNEIPNIFQTMYGALNVMSLVGHEFGSKIQLPQGWAVVLYPTPELWTLTLPHRTQILYSTDISMVIGRLNIGPGSIVCEAGTGSGSLSHALLRAVGPTGHLFTSDFHEERVNTARGEFERHGVASRVTVSKRDVFSDGFGAEAGTADAVFLDLPRPWLALHHALNAVRATGGRICSFSPCIEQVSKSCEAMERLGMQRITTLEVLTQELQLKHIELPLLSIVPDNTVWKRPAALEDQEDSTPTSNKRPRLEATETDQTEKNNQEETSQEKSNGEVKEETSHDKNNQEVKEETSDDKNKQEVRVETSQEKNNQEETSQEKKNKESTQANHSNRNGQINHKDKRKVWNEEVVSMKSMFVALPMCNQPGHTGFLTFCTVPPAVPRPVPCPSIASSD